MACCSTLSMLYARCPTVLWWIWNCPPHGCWKTWMKLLTTKWVGWKTVPNHSPPPRRRLPPLCCCLTRIQRNNVEKQKKRVVMLLKYKYGSPWQTHCWDAWACVYGRPCAEIGSQWTNIWNGVELQCCP